MMPYERSPSPLLVISPPLSPEEEVEELLATMKARPAESAKVTPPAEVLPVPQRKPVPSLPSLPPHFKTPKSAGRGLVFPGAGAMTGLPGSALKRHMYSPAVPSPLSRIVMMAEEAADEEEEGGPASPSEGNPNANGEARRREMKDARIANSSVPAPLQLHELGPATLLDQSPPSRGLHATASG